VNDICKHHDQLPHITPYNSDVPVRRNVDTLAATEMEDVIITQFIDAVESFSNFPWLAASRTSVLAGTMGNLAVNLQAYYVLLHRSREEELSQAESSKGSEQRWLAYFYITVPVGRLMHEWLFVEPVNHASNCSATSIRQRGRQARLGAIQTSCRATAMVDARSCNWGRYARSLHVIHPAICGNGPIKLPSSY
jgi:hypothetical protein